MLRPVRAWRLIVVTLLCATAVLGASTLAGKAGAQSRKVSHTCSAADRQFINTVSQNMFQLGYWANELQSDSGTWREVVKQSIAESAQVEATRPTDPTLEKTRPLLQSMFHAYARAVRAKARGGNAGIPMGIAYQMANDVHDLLAAAQPALAGKGCDPTVLLR
jgi:hypothetical protein